MSNLEKIKQIAEQMPDSPEKEQGLQAYENLKMFKTIADSFDRLINPESGRGRINYDSKNNEQQRPEKEKRITKECRAIR